MLEKAASMFTPGAVISGWKLKKKKMQYLKFVIVSG